MLVTLSVLYILKPVNTILNLYSMISEYGVVTSLNALVGCG